MGETTGYWLTRLLLQRGVNTSDAFGNLLRRLM